MKYNNKNMIVTFIGWFKIALMGEIDFFTVFCLMIKQVAV